MIIRKTAYKKGVIFWHRSERKRKKHEKDKEITGKRKCKNNLYEIKCLQKMTYERKKVHIIFKNSHKTY